MKTWGRFLEMKEPFLQWRTTMDKVHKKRKIPVWLDEWVESLLLPALQAESQPPIDFESLRAVCQEVSQMIEHGRITEPLKAKLKVALNQAESILINLGYR